MYEDNDPTTVRYTTALTNDCILYFFVYQDESWACFKEGHTLALEEKYCETIALAEKSVEQWAEEHDLLLNEWVDED